MEYLLNLSAVEDKHISLESYSSLFGSLETGHINFFHCSREGVETLIFGSKLSRFKSIEEFYAACYKKSLTHHIMTDEIPYKIEECFSLDLLDYNASIKAIQNSVLLERIDTYFDNSLLTSLSSLVNMSELSFISCIYPDKDDIIISDSENIVLISSLF